MTARPRLLRRSLEPELLDDPVQEPDELAHSLDQVAAVNRWLGGSRATLAHLRRLARAPGSVRVLDVGTGNARSLEEALDDLRLRGVRCRGVGVDSSPTAARIAAARARCPIVRADGLDLPFPDGAFDVVLCTLTLHHFSDPDATSLLAEMRRVCRGAVVVNDLERSRWNHAAARVLAATVWRTNRLTRHDGPLSVLRSFTAPELAELARRAGFSRRRVHRHFPWRLVLVAWP